MRTGDKDEHEVMTVVSVSSRLQVETERVLGLKPHPCSNLFQIVFLQNLTVNRTTMHLSSPYCEGLTCAAAATSHMSRFHCVECITNIALS